MELTENEFSEKYSKECGHCNRKTLIPIEYEFTCISCGYIVIKKNEVSKFQKKTKFIIRLKYAEHKKNVFVLKYIKYMKVMLMVKYTMFYQHSKIKN